jgi:hypothetical protein
MATGRSVPVARSEDPEAWQRAAYADVPIVTQWDDGHHTGTKPGTMATSSASMPYVVASMLRELGCVPRSRHGGRQRRGRRPGALPGPR